VSLTLESEKRGFGNANPLTDTLPAFLNDLLQTRALIRFQNRIHSVLPARQDPFRLARIERTQIVILIRHWSQNRSDFLRLLGLQTQIALQSIYGRNQGKPWWLRGTTDGALYHAACKQPADDGTGDKSCNQRQNNFPSS
jgi:hypothetical protein